MSRTPTAAIAAGSLIAGYAVAAASGSRPLGGFVLLGGGLCCSRVWALRDGPRVAAELAGVGFAAFVGSHLMALLTGPWPAVLTAAGVTGAIVWVRSDSRPAAAGRRPSGLVGRRG